MMSEVILACLWRAGLAPGDDIWDPPQGISLDEEVQVVPTDVSVPVPMFINPAAR